MVGDRVSDRMELYSVLPDLVPAGCVGLDEDPSFIDEPYDLAAEPRFALRRAWVTPTNYDQGTLVKMHLPDGARQAELTVGPQPSLMALSPDGTRAYVALFRNLAMLNGPWTEPGAVVIVDTQSMSIVDQVELCNAPLGVALDAARARLWVACAGSDALALVDLSGPTARLDRTIPLDDGAGTLGSQAAYVVLDGKHVFVTAQASGDLWIFDQETGAYVKRIAFGSSAFPQRLALVPGHPLLLVALDYLSQMAAIDTDALVVADTVPLTGVRAQGIAVTADAHYAIVTDERDLMKPGHVVRVDLNGLGAGGAHVDGSALAAVFPQSVILLP